MAMARQRGGRSIRLANDDEPSGRRSQFNIFSGTATAAVFASIALFLVLICVYCRCVRQSAISGARHRFIQRLRDHAPGSGGAPPLPVDCNICFEALRDDVAVRVVHTCGHVFHAPCIDRWLSQRTSCPVCQCTRVRGAGDGGPGPGGAPPLPAVRQAWDHAPGPAGAPPPLAVRYAGDHAPGPAGAPPLPAVRYAGDCSICFEAFRGDVAIKMVHTCGHVFHAPCIDRWLAVRNSCPVCRCIRVRGAGDHAIEATVGGGLVFELAHVVVVIEAIREGQREEEAQETPAGQPPPNAGGVGG